MSEDTIKSITGFGRFQILATGLIGSMSLLSAMAVYSTVFTDAYPNKLAPSTHVSLCTASNDSSNNASNEECNKYLNKTDANTCLYESTFGLTSSIEWKLACAHVNYSYLLQVFYMLGSIFSLVMGYLSDRYGRKRIVVVLLGLITTTIASSQLAISVLDLSVPLKYAIYSTSKFLLGILCVGLFNVAYVLLFELTAQKNITLVSNINVYLFVLGELVVALLSFVFQSWHVINWFIAVYAFVVLLLAVHFLSESPRFLIVNKRNNELYRRLKYIARINGKKNSLGGVNEKDIIDSLLNHNNSSESNSAESHSNETIFEYIFNSRRHLILRIILLSYIWLSLQLVYFGISLGITNVGNINPYLIYSISSIAEVIGYLFCHLNDKFSRKRVFTFFLGLAGLVCMLVSVLQAAALKVEASQTKNSTLVVVVIVLVCIGKAASSAAYNCAYMYTSLMFATRARNTILLFVAAVGRIGGIIAPLLNMLGDLVWKQLPYVLFSLASLLGAVFVMVLPDPSRLNEF